jgi:hypothetical protein
MVIFWQVRVDELVVAHVDAHVAEGAAQGVEKHQVTGLQFTTVDLVCGGCLLRGIAGQ